MKNSSTTDGSAFSERAIVYSLKSEACLGIFHQGSEHTTTGVLFVVGGRQYRVGAHRQFVLIARALAAAGCHVFRFDVRGMGDSGGDVRHYLDTAEDLSAALDVLKAQAPRVNKVLVWGLCDGATATIMSLDSLQEVDGVMLVNPWVSTNSGSARVQIKHYYRDRWLSADLWRRLLSGRLNLKDAVSSLFKTMRLAVFPSNEDDGVSAELPQLVFDRLDTFNGKLHLVVSDADLTAQEFYDAFTARYTNQNPAPETLSVACVDADHTFSGNGQHEKLVAMTLDFVALAGAETTGIKR